MIGHLKKCPGRLAAVASADSSAEETLLYLRVEDAYTKTFWLDMEVRGSAPLKKLDHYLRSIWLECCGHLSEFSLGGWGSTKMGMTRKVEDAFASHEKLTHIYDFGDSSETLITLIGKRRGIPTTKHPIALMGRNVMPQVPCSQCEAIASLLCRQCLVEESEWKLFCDKHGKAHGKKHDEYGPPVELVNSPRMGLCGYDGPAEPPY